MHDTITTLRALPESSTGNRSEQFTLIILTAIQFTNILDFVIMMPLGPQLMRIFSISPQQFGLVVSAYTFSAGASGFLAAFFLDRFDRKKALLMLYAGFTIGTFLCSLLFIPAWEVLRTETLGGFFLINAKNMNKAIQVAAQWPSAHLGSIEVRPIENGLKEDKRYA